MAVLRGPGHPAVFFSTLRYPAAFLLVDICCCSLDLWPVVQSLHASSATRTVNGIKYIIHFYFYFAQTLLSPHFLHSTCHHYRIVLGKAKALCIGTVNANVDDKAFWKLTNTVYTFGHLIETRLTACLTTRTWQ